MSSRKLLIGSVFLIFAGHALAQEMSTHELRSGLNADERFEKAPERATPSMIGSASLAMGYVRGVSDAMSVMGHCIPSNSSPGQKMAIVRKYLNDHPEQWNAPAVDAIVFALKAAFPCKSQSR